MSPDHLNIPGIKTLEISTSHTFGEPSCHSVKAELMEKPETCGRDNCCKAFHRHQRSVATINDTPYGGVPAEIELLVPRYKCATHHHTFTPQSSFTHTKQSMTNRLRWYVAMQGFAKPMSEVAKEVGLSTTKIRQVFDEVVGFMDARYEPQAPRILGIDGAHLAGAERVVFTDTRTRSRSDKKKRVPTNSMVIDISFSRSKNAIINVIRSWNRYDEIEYAVTDMDKTYIGAVKEAVPNIKVIIDKRHVLEYARRAMDEERKVIWRRHKNTTDKDLKDNLKLIRQLINMRRPDLSEGDKQLLLGHLKRYPRLHSSYHLKEQFYDIWEAPDRQLAVLRFEAWCNAIPDELKDTFSKTLGLFDSWSDEIFNYFDAGENITNGYTECANRLIKDLFRLGRGRTAFNRFRAKVLHKYGPWSRDEIIATVGLDLDLAWNFGVPVSELMDTSPEDDLNKMSEEELDSVYERMASVLGSDNRNYRM